MFNFFKKKEAEKLKAQEEQYFKKIDMIFEQNDPIKEIIRKISLCIDELDITIEKESIERAEKTWFYLFTKFFSYLVSVYTADPVIDTFLIKMEQSYFDFFKRAAFSIDIKKNILLKFINEFISNDYYSMISFIYSFMDKSEIDKLTIDNMLNHHLTEIIEKQTDAYLSDTKYSSITNDRCRLVELIFDIYQKDGNESRYLELAARELHNIEDYMRIINFMILKNRIDDAIAYCYEGIERNAINKVAYFEKLAEIHESQKEFEKAFAYRVKNLYLTNNKEVYYKIKKAFSDHPETKEYNARILNYLREQHKYSLLIEIFIEERRIEDAIEIAVLPDVKVEEKLWVAEHSKKGFPEETLVLYKDILIHYLNDNCKVEEKYCRMVENCLNEIKSIYLNLSRENEWRSYLASLESSLPVDMMSKTKAKS
ncbi:hypothetical protein HZA55_07890 [Candidatus Poribacteria bacterium]|nr:hypothetical protein [Candidatus Poribacteria bacterium]